MSDSYQITLGLGTPASIPRLTLFGLAINIIGIVACSLYERGVNLTLPNRNHLEVDLYDRSITMTLEDR